MDSLSTLAVRSRSVIARRSDDLTLSPTMINLLIALMVLIFVSLILVSALYAVRKVRQRRALARQQLPSYNEKSTSNHRRLTITTAPYGRHSSVYVYDEKSSILDSPRSPPLTPDSVPEIRITFPDEQDESGRPRSGRVLVVRVGENGAHGLEPLKDEEQLPAYQKESTGRFQSIDMERIGGLKEKSQFN